MIEKAINFLSDLEEKVSFDRSGIGVVFDDDSQVLLGLCILRDFRYNTWCFPGGGVEKGENIYQTAIREVFEETGIETRALPISPVIDTEIKGASFVLLKKVRGSIKPNEEFLEVDWFSLKDLPKKTLSQNIEVIKRFQKLISEKIG